MAAPVHQHNIYEIDTGDEVTNNMAPTQDQTYDRDLAWLKSESQPCGPSASSSVYSTSSEKGLTHEHVLSSPATSVCVSAPNGPFPDLEEEIRRQLDGRVASTTSACNNTMQTPSYNHEQGQHQNERNQESTCNSERWSQYSSASAASSVSLRKKSKMWNPLKWLHRSSGSRSSAQYQQLEQQESLDLTPTTSELKKTSLSDEIIRDLRTEITEKMGILEGKVDALSFSRTFTPQPRRRDERVDIGIQTNLDNIKQQEKEQDKHASRQIALEEKITHLSNANTNLSSLNTLLSSDLYSLQNTVQELQDEVWLLRDEKFSLEKRHGAYEEQRVQIELQTDIIRRLGVLLGRREEQLESERRMMKLNRDRINALEDKVDMLRTECETVLPLIISKVKEPMLTTVEIDKNK